MKKILTQQEYFTLTLIIRRSGCKTYADFLENLLKDNMQGLELFDNEKSTSNRR